MSQAQPHEPSTRRIRTRAVVVTWNAAALVERAVGSLLAQEMPGDLEVVVVDNASTDGTADVLAAAFPAVRVIRSPVNEGFAGGAARGIEGFTGDYVALLNNDATFAPGALAALVGCLEAPGNARVGAVTAKILLERTDGSGRALVNSTGNVVSRRGTGFDRDWLVPDGAESRAGEVFGFCGGAALLRVSALTEVGSFDPELFLYYEDTDLSWRLRAHGWAVRYEPGAVAHHRHAASSGVDTPLFRYYNTRNSLIVCGRHAPLAIVARAFLRQTAGLTRAALGRGPRHPLTRARARALRDAVRRCPRTLAERRAHWRAAPVSRRTVATLLA